MQAEKLTFKFGPLVEVDEKDVVEIDVPPLPHGFVDDGNGPVKGFEFIPRTTFTITDVRLNRLMWLSLIHGRKVTNNWLKMHGGVMTRKAWKKKN